MDESSDSKITKPVTKKYEKTTSYRAFDPRTGMAANAVSFNYSSTVNSLITFDGASHFSFTPSTGNFSVSTWY